MQVKYHLSNSAMKEKEKQKLYLSTQPIYYTFLKLLQPMQKQYMIDLISRLGYLIDLISRLGLVLLKFKALASNGASVMASVDNGAAVQLRENQI